MPIQFIQADPYSAPTILFVGDAIAMDPACCCGSPCGGQYFCGTTLVESQYLIIAGAKSNVHRWHMNSVGAPNNSTCSASGDYETGSGSLPHGTLRNNTWLDVVTSPNGTFVATYDWPNCVISVPSNVVGIYEVWTREDTYSTFTGSWTLGAKTQYGWLSILASPSEALGWGWQYTPLASGIPVIGGSTNFAVVLSGDTQWTPPAVGLDMTLSSTGSGCQESYVLDGCPWDVVDDVGEILVDASFTLGAN